MYVNKMVMQKIDNTTNAVNKICLANTSKFVKVKECDWYCTMVFYVWHVTNIIFTLIPTYFVFAYLLSRRFNVSLLLASYKARWIENKIA